MEEPKINACDVCYQQTFAKGPTSVSASVRWLAKFDADSSQKVDPTSLPGGEGGLVLLSSQPHCEEVQCEAPIRRDIVPHVVEAATTGIGRIFEAAWLNSPEINAALCQIGLNEAAGATYVPETGEIVVGAMGIHAAIITNNLLWPVNPSSTPLPNLHAEDIQQACSLSLDAVERILSEAGSDNSPTGKSTINSGDLLALHVICKSLQKVLDFADRYVPPPPVQEAQPLLPSHRSLTSVWVAATCAAVLLIFAFATRSVPPLIGLVVCACIGWWGWVKIPSLVVIEIPVAGLDWPKRLNQAKGRPGYPEILTRLRNCDLIARASRFCAGTPVAEPARLAGVLRAVWLAPGGSLLLPRLVHALSTPLAPGGDGVLRLAVLGEELLNQDSRGEGRALAASVATELTAAKAKMIISWSELSAEGSLKFVKEERSASAPRFLAALFRRAAAFQNICTRRTTLDDRFLTICDEIARQFMAKMPIEEPDAATSFVRCLDYLTIGGISTAIFTPSSGCTMEDMLRRTEEIWKDYEKLPDDPMRKTCETILERLGSLLLAKARMPMEVRSLPSRASLPSSLDHLCVERLFRPPAKGGMRKSSASLVPFVGDWWHAPLGPQYLGEFEKVSEESATGHGRGRWAMNLEAMNLRRWEQSGFPQKWVTEHRRQWNDSDWRTLLATLERTDFWPMERDAVGMILERLKTTYPTPRELTLETQNLQQWEQSGFPQKWVAEHHGQWSKSEWLTLLETLKRSEFWPMKPDAVGLLLEWLKNDDDTGSAPAIPVRASGPPGPGRPDTGKVAKIPDGRQAPASTPILPPSGGRAPRRRKKP